MLNLKQHNTLVAAVARYLPSNPSIVAVEPFVGPQLAQQIPPGSVLKIARWIVRLVLDQATPEMFIRIVSTVDAGEARIWHLAHVHLAHIHP